MKKFVEPKTYNMINMGKPVAIIESEDDASSECDEEEEEEDDV